MAQADKKGNMEIVKLENSTWERNCCGDGHFSSEIALKTGYVRVRAKMQESGEFLYEYQHFGMDMIPIKQDYPKYHEISQEELEVLLTT